MKPIHSVLPPFPHKNSPVDASAPGNVVLHTCANCHDMGFVEMPDLPGLHPCPTCELGRTQKQIILERRFQNSALPAAYRDATLESWRQALTDEQISGKGIAFFALRDFVLHRGEISIHRVLKSVYPQRPPESVRNLLSNPDDVRYGLSLHGVYGTGKTYLGACAINDLRQMGIDAIYARLQDIFAVARATWSDRSESDKSIIERYQNVDVLMIDDFNLAADERDQVKPYELRYAEEILRHRDAHQKSTIITCNLNETRFAEEWGHRTTEAALHLCHWIQVKGLKLRRTEQPFGVIDL